MAKAPRTPAGDAPPESFPETTPPRELYATSDIRFVLVELGKIDSKINTLTETVSKQSDELRSISTTVDRVKTGAIVAGSILSVVGVVFWWALGDRITTAVKNGLLSNPPVVVEPFKASPASKERN